MKIAVTVGHSILKNGSCTSADGKKMGGCQEYNWCKAFSKQLKTALQKNGHQADIIICPEKELTSKSQEKSYKVPRVNAGSYDLLMELHLNASENPDANGTEVLYKTVSGKRYAVAIEKQLAKVFKSRGAKQRTDLYILNQTVPPAVVLEAFFCTNKADYKKAKGLINRTKIAKLVAAGIGQA